MEPKPHQAIWDVMDGCSLEKTSNPIIKIKCQMIARVKVANTFPETPPKEYLGLDPLPFAPPHAVDIQNLFEAGDFSHMHAGGYAIRVDPFDSSIHDIDRWVCCEGVGDRVKSIRRENI